MAFVTPLRYPGGKGKLSYYVKSLIEVNGLCDASYVEPYAGGAAVAIDLLINEYVDRIYINDFDYAIYCFWYSVLNKNKELCDKIENAKVDIESWQYAREVMDNAEKYSVLEIGFATFFLNRCNRSGILKAGVIGGKNQSGRWKIDERFNKGELVRRVNKISQYSNRISLFNLDAVEFINGLDRKVKDTAFFYLDPPYYNKGQELYRSFYSHGDHVSVKDSLVVNEVKSWIVTYDNVEPIKLIYEDFLIHDYSLQYTAQDKRHGQEVMIFSDGLRVGPIKLGK